MYVMRLANGDSIVATGRDVIATLLEEREANEIVSVREISRFAVRLSPSDDGILEVQSWDASTLDDIFAHEYPVLNDALQLANSVPLIPKGTCNKNTIAELKEAYEQNKEVIRKAIDRERERTSALEPSPIENEAPRELRIRRG